MRIIITLVALLTIATSCTEQHMARRYGGKLKIELPKGEKLIMATWKEAFAIKVGQILDVEKVKFSRRINNICK